MNTTLPQYSRWLNVCGKFLNRKYSELKNTVIYSTFTVQKLIDKKKIVSDLFLCLTLKVM